MTLGIPTTSTVKHWLSDSELKAGFSR